MVATQQVQLLNGEKLIGLRAASLLVPGHRGNSHIDSTTVFRWITRGAKSASGKLVKLEGLRLGNRWVTSEAALARFAARLTEAEEPPATIPIPPPRVRPTAAASAELDQMLRVTRKPR